MFELPAINQAPKTQQGGLDSMRTFVEERNYWLEVLADKVHVMGSITDSHDIPRWLAEGNDDMSRYRWVVLGSSRQPLWDNLET